MKGSSLTHQEIVKNLLDTKAVNFEAIGAAVAKYGPGLSLAEEPWDFFCGTMRTFLHVYRVGGGVTVVEDLAQLKNVSGQLER